MGWFKNIFVGQEKVVPLSVTDANFEAEIIRSDMPVLLDVWSDGCMPCKQLEPIVMNLAQRYKGRVKVAEAHPSRAPQTLARLGIRGTPTVVYFAGGREVERVVGFRGSLYHSDFIDNELLAGKAEAAQA